MERRHPHIPGPRADELGHPLAHLGSGLVGEGNGQHLTRANVARGQQVGDPTGQHRRLARAGTGHDQQRGTLVQDGAALLSVQPVEEFTRRGRSGSIGHVNSHVSTNLPPFGDGFFAP